MRQPLDRPLARWSSEFLSDEEVVHRVLAGERELFELLMRRHNQRLFRTARASGLDEADAEEALQQAYVDAWRNLGAFEGRARFTTWMTTIVIRAAGKIERSRKCEEDAVFLAQEHVRETPAASEAVDAALGAALELSIAALPESCRTVFVLRAVEGLSTADVARDLGLSETAVKVRLHRARERLKSDLIRRAEVAGVLASTWPLGGERCDRVVARVLAVIRE